MFGEREGEVRECECVWDKELAAYGRGNAMVCVDALRPSLAFSGPLSCRAGSLQSLSPGNLRVETRGVVHRGMRKGVEACGEERKRWLMPIYF